MKTQHNGEERKISTIAVLVWFHGGGLASGLAGMYEPHYLMDYQVI